MALQNETLADKVNIVEDQYLSNRDIWLHLWTFLHSPTLTSIISFC